MPITLTASVVFLRIQDFARRPASEQARLRAQLEAVVAVIVAELPAEERVLLDAADGAAIVVLHDPVSAMRLAERALASASAGLPLCAALNHGPLQTVGKKGVEGMTGDGVAVAASIAQFTAPGRLFVSRGFREALADAAPGREMALVAGGSFNDAGLRAHELFKLDAAAVRRRSRRYSTTAAVLALALVSGGVTLRLSEGKPPSVDAMLAKVSHWRAFLKVGD